MSTRQNPGEGAGWALMLDKQDLIETIINRLTLPHVVLQLMLNGKKVEREHIKASLEDIGQAINLVKENPSKEGKSEGFESPPQKKGIS